MISNQSIIKVKMMHKRVVSREFVQYVVLEECAKLVNRRCFDLGFVPYQSPLLDNTVKLFGLRRNQ